MKKAVYFSVLKSIRDAIPAPKQSDFDLQFAIKEKNPSVALILSLLLGALGIDRFYIGSVGFGFLKLFILIVIFLGTIINLFSIVDGTYSYSFFLGFLRLGFIVFIVMDWFLIMRRVRARNIKVAREISNNLSQPNLQTNFSDFPSISTTANKTRNIAVFLLLIFIIAGLFLINHDGKEQDKANLVDLPQTTGYVLNEKERHILDILLQDDIQAFSKNLVSVLEQRQQSVSINKIVKAYDENQVAADRLYFKKQLAISGYIAGINSGIGNEPYLLLNGANPFLLPQAHFRYGNTEKIAVLKKGQKIRLACKGNGAIAGIPMFNDCQFAVDYAKQEASKIKLEINMFLKGQGMKSETSTHLSLLVITITKLLPETSVCFNGNQEKCLSKIRVIVNKKEQGQQVLQQEMKKVAGELKKSGIRL